MTTRRARAGAGPAPVADGPTQRWTRVVDTVQPSLRVHKWAKGKAPSRLAPQAPPCGRWLTQRRAVSDASDHTVSARILRGRRSAPSTLPAASGGAGAEAAAAEADRGEGAAPAGAGAGAGAAVAPAAPEAKASAADDEAGAAKQELEPQQVGGGGGAAAGPPGAVAAGGAPDAGEGT